MVAVLFIVFLSCVMLRMPIAFSLGFSSFIYIATATASEKDRYREETGARIAYKRLIDGQSIALPLPHGTDAEKFAERVFGRYERAMATALENEYNTKSEALRKEFAERGVEWLK